MKKTILFSIILVILSSCNNNGKNDNHSKPGMSISGAGATFPYPYYNIVFRDYMRINPEIVVNYGAIGSGGGIRSLRDKSVDFGASDAFLSDKEIASMPEIVHIATCMGGVVMAYTLPEVDSLKLTGPIVADMYLGKITRWNDQRIRTENPNIKLPDLEITPVYRSDGSGTTYAFSEYLCKVSPEWKSIMGKGKALKWEAGIAAKGNPGVAGIVQQTPGAIGYIGSEFALTLKLPTSKIKNKYGNYVEANLESISAAANVDLPDDMRATISDSADPNAYPMSLFTWLLVFKDQQYDKRTKQEAQQLINLLEYIISPQGQGVAAQINYAPLSKQAVNKTQTLIESIHYGNEQLEFHFKSDSVKQTTDSLDLTVDNSIDR
ncbi:MAG: phosphate ABC transporter substrate-binding protein PstS [Dysgonamonadaceae bacterium]|jgi:phosphate transport system substrate-binding protein|nr:phosphate ABC transporter substrate-binding protein PstS [Dysgonamonadaceae bacterium]MDD3309413.1 phosphate ABC transporter substrate-binding protein PstS [Dysgonamonadaceae bacterium]MDD3901089.1 phosphate ABC transporter substrate-binding protein PstS [Dysgonamonadaceae bacterium]MDD4399305.1 phosphate ABC transporter substrate-binding protein PstS [Dysgonamonadaceae bacterium]MEA5080641.1 phosphate ABC transporter substrate-binding protein PstS [Dysgonamonadaceae bacterium]